MFTRFLFQTAAALATCPMTAAAEPARRPNVIFILADDKDSAWLELL